MSRTPPSTIAPTSPWRLPVCAEMPPMLEMLATPWITNTSPGCARLCASNSAILLTWSRAPCSGSMRCTMLRKVRAGPTMVLPGMVGRSTEAPITPHGMPSSSIVSEMMPVGSPSAIRRSTAPCGGRGTAIIRMCSAAIRPVSRFSATVEAPCKACGSSCDFTASAPVDIAPLRRAAALDTVPASNNKGRNAMIDLYALTSPNVRKVYIALEELELPYKEIFVDVWKGDNYDPEFRKLNPNGKIPVIVDHDGPGGRPYTVIESGAILMYLADKT